MQARAMKRAEPKTWAKVARWAVALSVTGISCWLLVQDVDWQNVAHAFTNANYRWVVVGASAIIATFLTRTRRWQALLWQSTPRLQPTMTALLIGQVVNLALPMRSGDVVRAAWIGPERRTGTVEALGSIAIEKVWDLLALLVCGLTLLILMPLPEWFARSTWGTALTLLLATGLILATLHWQVPLFRLAGQVLARLPAGWDQAILPRLQRLANGLEAIRQPDVSVRAALWTGLTWGLGALANFAVLAAFDIPSVVAALFLLAALMVSSAVPTTPGKFGLFEAICVMCLTTFFQVSSDPALAAGLVLHAVVMVPPLITTAILTLWPGHRARHASD
jgi:uncharacterized membrane protein YbhN (UPF0104 family)